MSDLNEPGDSRDARTIDYLKEGIARRDIEIKRLEVEIHALREENTAIKSFIHQKQSGKI